GRRLAGASRSRPWSRPGKYEPLRSKLAVMNERGYPVRPAELHQRDQPRCLLGRLAMRNERRSEFAFRPFRLLPAERRLEKNGQLVRLGGRAFDLLTILVDHAGEVIPSRVLLEYVWRGLGVEESSLRA